MLIEHGGLTQGILQDTSHRETVRIGGIVRSNIITEIQVSSFKTSHLANIGSVKKYHGLDKVCIWIKPPSITSL